MHCGNIVVTFGYYTFVHKYNIYVQLSLAASLAVSKYATVIALSVLLIHIYCSVRVSLHLTDAMHQCIRSDSHTTALCRFFCM